MEEEGRIRNHRNRAGDADDENKYEYVKKGDDESIDDDASEVGWNSDDELAFHSTAMYRKKKSSRRNSTPSESEEESGSDDNDDAEGGILLSDMLFKNIARSKNSSASRKDHHSSEDDEDEEEDENEDEDSDESAGGSSGESGSEDSEGTDESNDDEDDDLEDVHSRLLSAIDRFAQPQSANKTASSSGKRHNNQDAAETAFSSAVDSGDVSMAALLGALEDTRGLSVVKKHLSDLEKGLAAPVHVEKVVADRMERSQVYAGSKEEMNKWQTTVSLNRHVGTLDLAHDKRQVRSFKSMVNRFVPTTDMEKEIQMVLVQHGASDKDAEQREVDELQGRNLSLQEIREKQAELAKVKALMFYEQMKRHRMNKIKSKAYRKIQKKKKFKQGQAGAEDDGEEGEAAKEKEAFNRVKERMDLRHKNTSKWAKMALQYGHTDKSLRAAYHESVQLGHELTQKMNEDLRDETRGDGSDVEEDGKEEGGDEEGEDRPSGSAQRRDVSNRASKAIQSLLAEGLGAAGSAAEAPSGRYKKLFEMDFMKRAAEQQKEKAREEAQSILREIEQMEEEYDSDLAAEVAQEEAKRGPAISKERLSQAKEEVKGMLGAGMAIRKGRKGQMTVGAAPSSSSASKGLFEFAAGDDEDAEQAEHSDEEEHRAMEAALESNPWLQPTVSSTGGKKRKASGTGAKGAADKSESVVYVNALEMQSAAAQGGKKSKSSTLSVASAPTVTAADQPSTSNTPISNEGKKKKDKKANKTENAASVVIETAAPVGAAAEKREKPAVPISLSEGRTQADLVQMAFAGPDLEAEFRAFKQAEIDEEHGVDEKKMKVLSDVKAGWGDWAGPGAGGMQISAKVLAKRDRLLTKIQQENATKVMGRADAKMMNVMISGRRVKTAAKYKISEIPHPFTSVEEYERSLQMPLGEEWNSSDVVKSNTQPAIKIRPGRVIEPIKLSKKRAAKAEAALETRLNKPSKKAKK